MTNQTVNAWGETVEQIRWAIDRNATMLRSAREVLSGVAEACGAELWITQTTLDLFEEHYQRKARKIAEDKIKYRTDIINLNLDEKDYDIAIERVAATIGRAVSKWIADETIRNDTNLKLAKRSQITEETVKRMLEDGLAPKKSYKKFGNAAHVLSEALNAGCNQIISLNSNLFSEDIDGWIAYRQNKFEEFPHARIPFIYKPTAAIWAMIGTSVASREKIRRIEEIASEITRPNLPVGGRERLEYIMRLSQELTKNNMGIIGTILSEHVTLAPAQSVRKTEESRLHRRLEHTRNREHRYRNTEPCASVKAIEEIIEEYRSELG